MVTHLARRPYFTLAKLALAVVFAIAPVSARYVMAGTADLPTSADQSHKGLPCPLHGDDTSHSTLASDAPAQRSHDMGSHDTGSLGTNCNCSAICHASAALPIIVLVEGPHGQPPRAGERVIAAHTYEPSPLPRPPKG
jgi:hypothetical protein